MVAGERSRSKVPLIASFEPVSTAETDPEPATVACMAMSMGTGDNRALNVFGGWALRTATKPRTGMNTNGSHFEERMGKARDAGTRPS